MAYGEQFRSRQIVKGADGTTGTRVFIVPWDDRVDRAGLHAIPQHNDQWTVAQDARLESDKTLWVHSVTEDPYGASSAAGSKKAATDCQVTVTYRSWPADLFKPEDWIVSARQIVQAAPTGQKLKFTTSKNKLAKEAAQLVSLIEFTIVGEQNLQSAVAGIRLAPKLAMFKVPGIFAQGTVCSEIFMIDGLHYVNDDAKRGALLFEGQSFSAPFDRGGLWIRKFERSILWRGVFDTAAVPAGQARRIVGGHNLQWDPSIGAGAWDTTDPPLYPTTEWKGKGIIPPGLLA